MTGKEVLKAALTSTQTVLTMYLSDLSDTDLLVRPVPMANNIAWQLGHLITSEVVILSELPGAAYPDTGLAAADYGKETAVSGPKGGYLTKAQYLDAFAKVRAASIANVERLAEADFDAATTGPLKQFAPRRGDLVILVANHTLMHGGQFTVVRRLLGKPILF
ncbi:MAG: DinB family protein [Gemmataceae bacterium]|nr:DinB family protein [Gemmataceae bacterium]